MSPPVGIEALLEEASWLQRLARSLVRDESTADDLVQETWLKALQKPPARKGNPRGWLAVVFRNLVRERFRREKSLARRESAAAQPVRQPDVADMAARVDVQRRVAEAVLALEDPYRTAVLLRYFEGMSGREIALLLDVPESTVRTRLSRALGLLRSDLDTRCDGDRRAWLIPLFSFPMRSRPATVETGGLVGAVGAVAIMAKIGVLLVVLVAVLAVLFVWAPYEGMEAPRPEKAATVPDPSPVADDETADLPPIQMREPGPTDVSGTVRDERSEPVPGAIVRFLGSRGRLRAPEVIAVTIATSEGAYVIGPVPREAVLEASAPGRATVRRRAFPGAHLDFVLIGSAPLEGAVLASEDLGPVRGALVILRHEPQAPGAGSLRSLFEERTNEAGRFRFLPLIPGRYTLTVHPQGASYLRRSVLLPPDGIRDLRLVLPPSGTVSGRVTDVETGQPIAGAEIAWRPDDAPALSVTAVSDSEGRYTLGGFPVRSPLDWDIQVALLVRGKGYYPQERRLEMLLAAEGKRVDLSLRRGGSIRGKVVAGGAEPVAGARVRVAEEGGWAEVVSGDDGTFSLEGIEPGPQNVEAATPGAGSGTVRVEVTASAVAEGVLVRLEPAAAEAELAILVVDGDGIPVAGATVHVAAVDRERWAVPRWGETDTTGAYLERWPRDTPCRILAGAPGFLPTVLKDVLAGSGERLRIGLERGTMLRGRVVDDAGRPIPGASVRAQQDLESTVKSVRRRFGGLNVSTGTDGVFEIGALYPGQVSISVYYGVKRASRRGIDIGTGSLEIVLPGSGSLTGRVVGGRSGRPVHSCWVRLKGPKLALTKLFSAESGRFAFEGVPDGDYVVEASWIGGYSSLAVPARVQSGRTVVEPVIQLARGGAVDIVVRDEFGEPLVSTAYGEAISRGDRERRHWFSEENGRISTGPLTPGLYRFWIENHPENSAKEVQIEAGQTVEVMLWRNPPGCLAFAVSGPDGQPIEGAEVRVRGPGGVEVFLDSKPNRWKFDRRRSRDKDLTWEEFERNLRKTDRKGRILFPGLPPGNYEITVTAPGYRKGAGSAAVSEEGAVATRIELMRGRGIPERPR